MRQAGRALIIGRTILQSDVRDLALGRAYAHVRHLEPTLLCQVKCRSQGGVDGLAITSPQINTYSSNK